MVEMLVLDRAGFSMQQGLPGYESNCDHHGYVINTLLLQCPYKLSYLPEDGQCKVYYSGKDLTDLGQASELQYEQQATATTSQ